MTQRQLAIGLLAGAAGCSLFAIVGIAMLSVPIALIIGGASGGFLCVVALLYDPDRSRP